PLPIPTGLTLQDRPFSCSSFAPCVIAARNAAPRSGLLQSIGSHVVGSFIIDSRHVPTPGTNLCHSKPLRVPPSWQSTRITAGRFCCNLRLVRSHWRTCVSPSGCVNRGKIAQEPELAGP